MRIRIELDEDNEEEIVIKCKKIDERINSIQRLLKEKTNDKQLIFYKDNTEYYLNLNTILFFETDGIIVSAHTVNDSFVVKYKLYELETMLPSNYLRVSKSTILNINHVYSINRNVTSSSMVEFSGTHKKVYASRLYYKLLKEKMEGRILYER